MAIALSEEIRGRVPPANLAVLEIDAGASIFEAREANAPVNSVTFHVRSGEVLIGVAMIHQELLDRYAPSTSIDEVVRADIFSPRGALEFDTWRAAVPVDWRGVVEDPVLAWDNIFDALEAFRKMGIPKGWEYFINGEKVGTT